uniref:Uncharacterized protein n=1 Tax=Knipowitschia caucasica TaxID=637954 RepID=A0AAV2M4B5_KNICA
MVRHHPSWLNMRNSLRDFVVIYTSVTQVRSSLDTGATEVRGPGATQQQGPSGTPSTLSSGHHHHQGPDLTSNDLP